MTQRGIGANSDRSGSVRLSLNVPADVASTIKDIAKYRGTTVTNVVRDAIQTEKILLDAKRARSRFFIENESGDRQTELIFR